MHHQAVNPLTTFLTFHPAWPLPVVPPSCLLPLLLYLCHFFVPTILSVPPLCVCVDVVSCPKYPLVSGLSLCFHSPTLTDLHHSVHSSPAFQPHSWSWRVFEKCIWMKMISPDMIRCLFSPSYSADTPQSLWRSQFWKAKRIPGDSEVSALWPLTRWFTALAMATIKKYETLFIFQPVFHLRPIYVWLCIGYKENIWSLYILYFNFTLHAWHVFPHHCIQWSSFLFYIWFFINLLFISLIPVTH